MAMRRLCPKTQSFTLLLIGREPNPLSRGSHSLSESRRLVKVSVWWDLENCAVPPAVDFFRVGPAITAAVRANGIRGPIEITAFGDILLLPRLSQDALFSTGINLSHIPRSEKNSTDQSLIFNLMNWVSHNPPPANLFLISGDKGFAGILNRLRMNNYNILLATPESAHGALCCAATTLWNWNDLLRGENLTGKNFNQPPDGPYNSWYSYSIMPLSDPFSSDAEKRPCFPPEETTEPSSENNPRLVPKSVRQHIRRIVESNPKGMTISELRVELASVMNLDKDYYGYKQFVPFLMSLEDIVKLRQVSPGNYIVHSVDHDGHIYEDEDVTAPSETSCDDEFDKETNTEISVSENLGRASSTPPSDLEGKDKNSTSLPYSPAGNLLPVDEKNFKTLGVEKVDEKIVEIVKEPESDHHFPHGVERIVETVDVPESGSCFPVAVRQESSSEVGVFKRFWRKWFGSESSNTDDSSCIDEVKLEGKDLEKDSKLTIGFADGVPPPFSEPVLENTKPESLDPGNWFKSTLEVNKLSDYSCDEENLISRDSGHELFSKDSFWSSVRSFMDTSQGSVIVSESRSREHMARELQRKGPECLKSLGENDSLRLVNLLISKKKWVEECPSEAFPFKPTQVEKSSESESFCQKTSNSMSSLFMSPSLPSVTKVPRNRDRGEAENGSCAVEGKLPVRSRDEVLADCQKLINEMLKENTNGFSMGLFRQHFFERNGYHLDFKKLGQSKMSALLRTIPGVTIKSGHIFPHSNASAGASSENKTASDDSLSDSSMNCDGLDSFSEELGPFASDKMNVKFSDSDETCPINKNESVLAVLNSWQDRPVGEQRRVQARNQKRPQKKYSFVSDNATKELANTLIGAVMHDDSSKVRKTGPFVGERATGDSLSR